MTKEQSVNYDMYERVVLCGKENAVTVARNPVFQGELAALENLLPEMRRLSGLINTTNDHADTKQSAKTEMVSLGVDVCANLGGYGVLTKDKTLAKLANASKSSLGTGKAEEILERCQGIADKAEELLPELMAKRGMPKILLAQFRAAIEAFRTKKTAPRSSLQDKSVLIGKLEGVFDDADVVMTLLTSSAVNFKTVADAFKTEAADFLKRFTIASTVIGARVSKTKAKFVVDNGETKEKITNFGVESTTLNIARTLMSEKTSVLTTKHHKGSDFIISSDGFESAFVERQKLIRGKVNVIKVTLMPKKREN